MKESVNLLRQLILPIVLSHEEKSCLVYFNCIFLLCVALCVLMLSLPHDVMNWSLTVNMEYFAILARIKGRNFNTPDSECLRKHAVKARLNL